MKLILIWSFFTILSKLCEIDLSWKWHLATLVNWLPESCMSSWCAQLGMQVESGCTGRREKRSNAAVWANQLHWDLFQEIPIFGITLRYLADFWLPCLDTLGPKSCFLVDGSYQNRQEMLGFSSFWTDPSAKVKLTPAGLPTATWVQWVILTGEYFRHFFGHDFSSNCPLSLSAFLLTARHFQFLLRPTLSQRSWKSSHGCFYKVRCWSDSMLLTAVKCDSRPRWPRTCFAAKSTVYVSYPFH